MPKVISRSTVSASTDAVPTQSSAAALRAYYCICGEFILVIDKALRLLPTRLTDAAIIVRAKTKENAPAHVFKLNSKDSGPVLLKREEGHERHYRHMCPRCNLLVAYQTAPPPARNADFLYIVSGALSEVQGQVPPDAFLGEDLAA